VGGRVQVLKNKPVSNKFKKKISFQQVFFLKKKISFQVKTSFKKNENNEECSAQQTKRSSSAKSVEDGCCPFKIVFDEDLYAVFDEDIYVLSMYLCFALNMS